MAFINGVEVLFSAQVVKEGVVQTKGNSTTDVMSQKAVTTELNALDEKINKIDGGIVVENYSELIALLDSASADDYKLGQAIYVRQKDVPDLWISDIDPDNEIHYEYTTDEQLIADMNDTYSLYRCNVGHYAVSIIEAEKQDLSSCATKSEVNALRDKVNAKIVITDKRLANLEAGIPDDDFVTDDSTAYVRDVPSNALPFAEVGEIGGVTRKCTNLATPVKEHGIYGFKVSPNLDGSITISGSAVSSTNIVIDLIDTDKPVKMNANEVYSFSVIKGGVSASTGCMFTYTDALGGTVYGWNNQDTTRPRLLKRVYLQFTPAVGGTDPNGTYYVMVNKGAFSQPYEPFFEGLRSAPVYEVVSEGASLLKAPYTITNRTMSGLTITVDNNTQSITLNGTYTGTSGRIGITNFTRSKLSAGKYYCHIGARLPASCSLYSHVGDTLIEWIKSNAEEAFATVATSGNVGGFDLWVAQNATFDNVTIRPMLVKSDVAVPYRPYIKRTLAIPEAVRPAHGIPNTDCYDRIRWRYDEQADKWVREKEKQMEEIVFNGTENIEYDNKNKRFLIYFNKASKKYDIPCLCTAYEYNTNVYGDPNREDGIIAAGGGMYVRDARFESVAELKAHFAEQYANGTPVTVVYALAEPEITDISHLLPEDNLIGVEGRGPITMANEYGYDVPAKVTYQIKEETV